jgi:hypothetical protein
MGGFWLLVFSFWFLVFGKRWFLVVSFWFLVFGFWEEVVFSCYLVTLSKR